MGLPDGMVVLCGGNDLGGGMAPEVLDDTSVDRHEYFARVVFLCKETIREHSHSS